MHKKQDLCCADIIWKFGKYSWRIGKIAPILSFETSKKAVFQCLSWTNTVLDTPYILSHKRKITNSTKMGHTCLESWITGEENELLWIKLYEEMTELQLKMQVNFFWYITCYSHSQCCNASSLTSLTDISKSMHTTKIILTSVKSRRIDKTFGIYYIFVSIQTANI